MFGLDFALREQETNARRKLRCRRRFHRPTLDMLEDRQLMTSDLIGTSFPISTPPVEGKAFTAVVAKFADADGNTNPDQYAASINWGDGNSTQGTIVSDPSGGFDVVGTYTFSQAGPFRVTAQVGDKDGDTVSISTTNIVSEAPITATGVNINSSPNGRVAGTVATFTDADASLNASAFSATINWGDGQTSAGTIAVDKAIGGFEVSGVHTYTKLGGYMVQTKIQQGNSSVVSTQFYTESDLISDGAVAADHINPNLVNPWGLVAPNPGDFWDSNNGSGTSLVFDSSGNLSQAIPVVTLPTPAGDPDPAAPSGIVFNSTSSFVISDGTTSGKAVFLFSTEDGTVSGWNPKVSTNGSSPSTQAFLAVDNSASGAVYKGLTMLNIPAGNPIPAGTYLFASNFHAGTIDVFDQNFAPVALPAGAFQDPALPAGYAPFGIQTLNGNLYVTYALQDAAKHDDVAGPGHGYVDVYSPSGSLIQRLGGPGIQPELNSPWGLTLAPSNFGQFSNDLLVGNFGNSHINVFNPKTGAFLGQLSNSNGQPLVLDGGVQGSDGKGLWGIFAFGNGNGSGPSNTLYFNSGFNDENDGLFGTLTATSVATASATSIASVGSRAAHSDSIVPEATNANTLVGDVPVLSNQSIGVLGTLATGTVDTATDTTSAIFGSAGHKAKSTAGA